MDSKRENEAEEGRHDDRQKRKSMTEVTKFDKTKTTRKRRGKPEGSEGRKPTIF